MNRWAAFALGTVALVAGAALFVAGHWVPAGIAVALGTVFDVLFVLAVRDANANGKNR